MDKPDKQLLSRFGVKVEEVDVLLSTRFFHLFSENLYRSPNKAFEELVSNSWDAGARTVHIGIPPKLMEPDAAIWVLDDGESMDSSGLKELWRIASSNKTGSKAGRQPIGKFGIGKLSTYLLASRLTYICRAADGIIRLVEMDYEAVEKSGHDKGQGGGSDLLVGGKGIPLALNVLEESDLTELLSTIQGGDKIRDLIDAKVPVTPTTDEFTAEFGRPDRSLQHDSDTWTLVIMAGLKDLARKIQTGWVRYILRAALPLGNSMNVVLNSEPLSSTKIDLAIRQTLLLDNTLGFSEFDHVPDPLNRSTKISKSITFGTEPFPHVKIEGVPGEITGSVRRYEKSISGKKSDALARSNGFFVNVLGRVVNVDDPYFGLEDLNHSVWSEFRACIRADGLNELMGINREQLNESDALAIFRSFLRELFNRMRRAVDQPEGNSWKNAGTIINQSWGAIPLRSFRRSLRHYAESGHVPKSISVDPKLDMKVALDEWEEAVEADPASSIKEVAFSSLGIDAPLFAYQLAKSSIVVNLDHPFVRMHGKTAAEQSVLRDIAVAEILSAARLTDIGVSEELISDYQDYRDDLFRIITIIRRDSGVTIAEQLINAIDDEEALETLIGEALAYIGFEVEVLGRKGEAEGLASSPLQSTPKQTLKARYSFTYEAKSTTHKKVRADKVGVDVVDHHRKLKDADYVLVIAKDFQAGMLAEMCAERRVTPMRAQDLARLLMLAAGTGALDLDKFRRLFDLSDPSDVESWTDQFIEEALQVKRLSLNDVLTAVSSLDSLRDDEPINCQVIAQQLRRMKVGPFDITREDIKNVFVGLSVLIPSLCMVSNNDIYLGTSPARFRDAVAKQVDLIPAEFRFALSELATSGKSPKTT